MQHEILSTANSNHRLAVVGYSTRSLAQAASSLGFEVVAFDRFCDWDTRQIAECVPIDDWPNAIVPAVQKYVDAHGSFDGVLLGGGTENVDGLIDDLAQFGRVLGPTSTQMRTLRLLHTWEAVCNKLAKQSKQTIALPKTIFPNMSEMRHQIYGQLDAEPPGAIRWLKKNSLSAGGLGITRGVIELTSEFTKGFYQQQEVVGLPLGIHLLLSDAESIVLGCSAAFTANDCDAPGEFIYRGSYGPLELNDALTQQLIDFGKELQIESGYRGILQADFILDPLDRLWLLEVNPRWAASAELVDDQSGARLLAAHLSQYPLNSVDSSPTSRPHSRKLRAKRIVYAMHPMQLDRIAFESSIVPLTNDWHSIGSSRFRIADVPDASKQVCEFSTGEPVLTLLWEGEVEQPESLCVTSAELPSVRSRILADLALAELEVLDRFQMLG